MGTLESRLRVLEQQRVHIERYALIVDVFGCDCLTPEQLEAVEQAEQNGQPYIILGAASPPIPLLQATS